MHKKHIFLSIFSKIAIFACAFCAFFISPVFATLPTGYTELEYIESTGTQYIDTNYFTNANIKTEYQFIATAFNDSVYCSILSARVSNLSNSISYGFNTTTVYASFGNNSEKSVSTIVQLNQKYTIVQDKTGLYTNGVKTSYSGSQTLDFNNPLRLYLFARNNNGTVGNFFIGKSYYAKIWDNGTLVRDYIPAKRLSDNAIGMFDTVSQTFFTNAGTGDFIAGPEVVIKIATTKMVDEEFAAAEAKLAATVQTIESVVSRTIAQTGQIQVLQDTKQTRPDESCPANMKCLLVQDEDGTPHWYPIIEP